MYRREVLEAACCLSVGLDESKLLKLMASELSMRPIRFVNLDFENFVAECARMEGHDIPRCSASVPQRFEGFSTMSLPGILGERHEQDALGRL